MTSPQDTAQRLIQAERISIRAVVLTQGEDPTPHLLRSGIFEPVAIPFAFDHQPGAAASMGDGWTPAVTATLEFDAREARDNSISAQQATEDNPDPVGSDEPPMQTVNLPEAFGMRPLAPVRRPART